MKKLLSGTLMGTDKKTCPKRVEALWSLVNIEQGDYKYRVGVEDNLAKTYTIYDTDELDELDDTLEYVKRTSYEEVTSDTQKVCDSNRYVFDIWSRATGEGYIYVADELPEMFVRGDADKDIYS